MCHCFFSNKSRSKSSLHWAHFHHHYSRPSPSDLCNHLRAACMTKGSTWKIDRLQGIAIPSLLLTESHSFGIVFAIVSTLLRTKLHNSKKNCIIHWRKALSGQTVGRAWTKWRAIKFTINFCNYKTFTLIYAQSRICRFGIASAVNVRLLWRKSWRNDKIVSEYNFA